MKREYKWPQGYLTDSEWQSLLAIEYCLTHGYSKQIKADTKRLIALRKKSLKTKIVRQ